MKIVGLFVLLFCATSVLLGVTAGIMRLCGVTGSGQFGLVAIACFCATIVLIFGVWFLEKKER